VWALVSRHCAAGSIAPTAANRSLGSGTLRNDTNVLLHLALHNRESGPQVHSWSTDSANEQQHTNVLLDLPLHHGKFGPQAQHWSTE
jgi:hypothetical protein